MNNLERIRAMSEEDLAEFLFGVSKGCFFEDCERCALEYPFCRSAILIRYWLRSEERKVDERDH